MKVDLKLADEYDGLVYLSDARLNPPALEAHAHDELELNLVARGSVTYVVDGRRTTFSQRDLFWLFPDQVHQLVDRSPDSQFYVAVFKPSLILETCRGDRYRELGESRPRTDGVLGIRLEPADYGACISALQSLMRDGLPPEVLNREVGYGARSDFHYHHSDPDWLNAGLRQLLLRAWRYQVGHRGIRPDVELHPSVRRALAIFASEDVPEDLGRLAEQCGASSAYLSRLFRRQVGVTLSRYRNSMRLGRFWRLLRGDRPLTLMAAALEAGFGSYAQFYRVFQEAYGAGPREMLGQAEAEGAPGGPPLIADKPIRP